MFLNSAVRPALLLAAAVTLALGGCATRESVEHAQMTADLADSHAVDARGRADQAYSRADQAYGIGSDALGKAQNNQQKVAALESDLKAANARIKWLSRNVVFKHPIRHARKRKPKTTARAAVPAAAAPVSTATPPPPVLPLPKNPGM